MSDDVGPDDERETDQRFEQVFGISKEELRAQGIDPSEYTRTHIADALGGEAREKRLGAKSSTLMSRSLEYGVRIYYWFFASLGTLMIVHFGGVFRPMGLIAACVSFIMAIRTWLIHGRIYSQYKEACKREGKTPNTMMNRPMPDWLKKLNDWKESRRRQ